MTELVLVFGTIFVSILISVSIGAAFVAGSRRASKD